jgi:hypothetical protein
MLIFMVFAPFFYPSLKEAKRQGLSIKLPGQSHLKSDAHQAQQVKGLEERLTKAAGALCALTPAPGRGRRQQVTAASLHEAIEHTLATHRVARPAQR